MFKVMMIFVGNPKATNAPNRPHSGDYALDEVFDWIAQITGR